jgi:hypothetical protein
MKIVVTWLSLLLAASSVLANPQELRAKAQELVKAQSIVWYGAVHVDQAVPPELIDLLSLKINQALGQPQAWHPDSPLWLQFRVNIQNDVDTKLRERWFQVSAQPAQSDQSLSGLLAKTYSELYTAQELADATEFYQSAAGKKYISYLNSLRRLYYRGQIFWEWQALRSARSGQSTTAELLSAWEKARSTPAEQSFAELGFEWTSLERILPGVVSRRDALSLLVGMDMGAEATRPLQQILSPDERRQVAVFHQSSAGKKERIALKQIHGLAHADQEWPALMHGHVSEDSPLVRHWLSMRRHVASIHPEPPMRLPSSGWSLPESYELHALDSDGLRKLSECLPGSTEDAINSLRMFIASKQYLRSSTAMGKTGVDFLYVTRGDRGACVPLTQDRVPVLSKQSLLGAITLKGLTPAEQTTLLEKNLSELVKDRASSVLLVGLRGEATEINYAFEVTTPIRVVYNTRYLAAGTYQLDHYRYVMRTGNLQSVSVTANLGQRGEPLRFKHILTTAQEVERDAQMRQPGR